jgi:predicted transcriptional regulator
MIWRMRIGIDKLSTAALPHLRVSIRSRIQANQFAAALLMPTRLVRYAVERLAKPLQEADVKTLASEFRVSEQAMITRLTTLGFSLVGSSIVPATILGATALW